MAAFAQLAIQAVVVGELRQPHEPQELAELAIGHVGILLEPEHQVVPQGAVEQAGGLGNVADPSAQRIQLVGAMVHAVDPDAAGVELLGAHQRVGDRGLAGAGFSHQGHLLAGRDVERDAVEGHDRLAGLQGIVGRPGVVAEHHLVEFDAAPQAGWLHAVMVGGDLGPPA